MSKPENLMEIIGTITDPRVTGRTKHKLDEIIAIAMCAVISGAESWVEIEDWALERRDWLDIFLELENGIPSHDSFGRVFSILDSEALQEMFYDWVKNFTKDETAQNIIHIDGKFLNGSLVQNDSRKSTSIISAWSSTYGIVMGMKETKLEKGKGEKLASLELIERLYLKGCIVSLDAMGATVPITDKIVEKQGDYVIGLKDNHRWLKNLCVQFIGNGKNKNLIERYETKEVGHGRKEERVYEYFNIERCNLSEYPTLANKAKDKWKTLNGFCRVQSLRVRNGIEKTELRYYYTSLKKNVEQVASVISCAVCALWPCAWVLFLITR